MNAERFWSKVDRRGPDDCWPWLGGTTNGYGIVSFTRDGVETSTTAHRYAYELLVGPLPPGHRLELDHLCQRRDCVNPRHTEPVTPLENTRRSFLRGNRPYNPRRTS